MADAVIFVALEGAQKYRDLSKRLKAAADQNRGLQRELHKAIRGAGRPAVLEVRRAVKAINVKEVSGGGRSERAEFAASRVRTDRGRERARRGAGLRDTIARATRVEITAKGIRIIVNGSQLPPKQRTLPMALGSRRGWRHPLYGNRNFWYTQIGKPGWFHNAVLRHANDFRRNVDAAMDEIESRIAG